MFNRKQNEIDKLNARCVELAEQIKDIKIENKELMKKRHLDANNNIKILEQNNIKTELIQEINKLVNCNKCNNEKIILSKIKELISDGQS